MAWFNPENQNSQKLAETRNGLRVLKTIHRNACEGETRKLAEFAVCVSNKNDNNLTVCNDLLEGVCIENNGLGDTPSSPVDKKGQITERPTPPPPPVLVSRAAYPASSASLRVLPLQPYSCNEKKLANHLRVSASFLRVLQDRFPTTCKNCESFQLQADHPHAGRCLAGHYPQETLWDSDLRWCRQVPPVSQVSNFSRSAA